MSDAKYLEIEGEDGSQFRCELLDVVPVDGTDYAVLRPEGGDSLVVMRIVERDAATVFRAIEDDAEFERIAAYFRELARQALDA